MNSGKNDPDCMEPVEDRVDILFRELELAIKWQRPSLLLAIYSTETAYHEAEAKLKNNLYRLGHQVHHLQNKTNNFSDYASQVAAYSHSDKAVFFADGFDWSSLHDQNYDHNTFEQSRDFFIKNKIRIVFWLTETNANALAHFAPDFWTFRHCSVEFIEIMEFVGTIPESEAIQPNAENVPGNSNNTQPEITKGTPIEHGGSGNNLSEESNINLLLTLGVLNWRKGEHEKAIEILESAMKLSAQIQSEWVKALCFNSLALVQTSMGKIDDAIKTYEQARPIAPSSIFPWTNLGNLYSKVKRDEDAIASYQKAIEVDSRDAISWNGLGDVYIKTGRTEDAISAYQKAIEYAPDFACSWNGLGNAYVSAGHPETAVNAYQRTIDLDKKLINPWLNLGNIYKNQKNSDEAIKAYQKAMELDPKDARIRVELGDLYAILGKNDQAINSYSQAIELDPENGSAYCNQAVIYTRLGEYAKAVPLYQKSIELLNMDGDKTVLWDRLGDKFNSSNTSGPIPETNEETDKHESQKFAVHTINPETEETSSSSGAPTYGSESPDQNPVTIHETVVICEEGTVKNIKVTPTLHPDHLAASADSYEISHEPTVEELANPHPSQTPATLSANPHSVEATNKTEKSNRIRFGWKFGNPFSFSGHPKRTSHSKPIQNLVILDKSQALPDQIQRSEEVPMGGKNALGISESHQQSECNGPGNVRNSDNFNTDSPVVGDDMPAYSSADVHTEIDFINAQEWNEIGKVYFSLGDMEQAVLTFNKAIEMNPKFGWPYSNMALAYTQQGRFEEAVFVYKKSIELFRDDKNKAIAWNRLGNVYLRMGNDEKAIAAYRMADQLDAENGVSEPSSGDLLPEFESYNAHVWNEVGRIYYNKNIYDKAIEAYQKAVNIDPSFGWSYSNLALAYSRQGRYAEAIPLYNKSIDLFRNDREKAFSWNRLGDTYRRLNDHDNALAAYEMAAGLDPDNNSLLKRARFSLLSNCAAR